MSSDKVPDAFGIGDRRAEQRRAVIDLDGAVDLGHAGQRHDLDVGNVVAGDAAVDRLQADGRGAPGRGVDDDVCCGRRRAGVAGAVGRGCGEVVVAVGQAPCGDEAPGAVCARDRAAEQRGAVIDLDRGIGLRRAGKREDIGAGDAVAGACGVGRDRADHRCLDHRRRRRRLNGADRDRGVAELQEVDVLERVGAVRAAGAQIDDLPAAVGVLRHLVGRRSARNRPRCRCR